MYSINLNYSAVSESLEVSYYFGGVVNKREELGDE